MERRHGDDESVTSGNVSALTTLAREYAAERRWHEALATMQLALRRFYEAYRAGKASAEDFVNAVHMLAALGEDERLYRLYRRCARGKPAAWDEAVLTHMGIAAFNMGRFVEARWLWRAALRRGGSLADVLDALLFTVEAIETGRIPPLTLDHRLRVDEMDSNEADVPAVVKVLAVRGLWDERHPAAREAALDLLAQLDDPWSADFLFTIVTLPDLADHVKLKAAAWLLERGFVQENEPVTVHVEGRLQQVRIERGDAYASLEHVSAPAPERSDTRAGGTSGPTDPQEGGRSPSRRAQLPSIDPAWRWEKALASLKLAQLREMARRLQVKNLWEMRKEQLATAVAERLRYELPQAWQALTARERSLLRWIDEQGGVVPLEQLRERSGLDAAILERLGLVFVGRSPDGEQPVAVLPEEVRRRLREVWS